MIIERHSMIDKRSNSEYFNENKVYRWVSEAKIDFENVFIHLFQISV